MWKGIGIANYVDTQETKETSRHGCSKRLPYTAKFWKGKKLANLVNREPFATCQYSQIHGIHTDCCYSPNFSSPIAYLHGSPKFSPAKYFPCTVAPYRYP